MESEIDDLVRRLVHLEDELERKLTEQRARLRYRMEERRAVFEEGMLRQHRQFRIGILTFLRNSPFATLVIAPAVYGLILPLALLDLGVYLYVLICFPAWNMERVRRAQYVIVDRHRLAYLNGIEKLNCAFCGYANGVIAYAREAASRSEQYWCPIKHALRVRAPHPRYRGFAEYGDAEDFRERREELRQNAQKRQKTPTEKPK